MTDLISRADAIEAVMKHKIPFTIQQEVAREIDALPSANYITESPNEAIKRQNDVIETHGRLIDADALIKVLDEKLTGYPYFAFKYAKESVDDAPTVCDCVAVVRCKDCKWQKFIDWGMGDCLHPKGSRHIAYDNHYCSYGERAEQTERREP